MFGLKFLKLSILPTFNVRIFGALDAIIFLIKEGTAISGVFLMYEKAVSKKSLSTTKNTICR